MVAPTPTPEPVVAPTPTPEPLPTPLLSPAPSTTQAEISHSKNLITRVATIHFGRNSYYLMPLVKKNLVKIVMKLNLSSIQEIRFYGYTDDKAGVDNLWLSKARAEAVESFFKTLIKGKALQVRYFGSAKPIFPCVTASACAANRRVDVWVR